MPSPTSRLLQYTPVSSIPIQWQPAGPGCNHSPATLQTPCRCEVKQQIYNPYKGLKGLGAITSLKFLTVTSSACQGRYCIDQSLEVLADIASRQLLEALALPASLFSKQCVTEARLAWCNVQAKLLRITLLAK